MRIQYGTEGGYSVHSGKPPARSRLLETLPVHIPQIQFDLNVALTLRKYNLNKMRYNAVKQTEHIHITTDEVRIPIRLSILCDSVCWIV